MRIGMTAVVGALTMGSVSLLGLPHALPSSSAAQAVATKKLLFLTHNAFYKHTSLEPAERAVAELGAQGGFDVLSLEGYKQPSDKIDLSIISATYLAQFDAVMMMTNGELPMTDEQKEALVDFVRNGKGFIGVHQTMVTFYTFPPFGEMLGAYFANGPILDPTNKQKRMAVLKVENRKHPATRMLGASWTLHDEIYQFARKTWDPASPKENVGPTGHPVPFAFSRDRVTVLLSVDSEKTDFTGLNKGWERGGDYPQAWYQQFGRGRSIYTSLGHRDDLWSHDHLFRAHILGAIRWALGLENQTSNGLD
jgi:type 1 glutamine amidotransferase